MVLLLLVRTPFFSGFLVVCAKLGLDAWSWEVLMSI